MTEEQPAATDSEPPLEPTAPESYRIELRGFDTEESAHSFANLLRIYIRELSRHIDMERLDGITVAYDYKEALAGLDRGFETSRALTPTEESFGIGVAMTPAVMREGVVKSHIVFSAGIIRILENHDHEYHKDSLYLVAHECGHVHDQKYRDLAFPGVLLRKKAASYEQDVFQQIVQACWDEYAACRLSAGFATDGVIKGHEDTLLHRLENTRTEASEAIKAYRMHGDVQRLLIEAAGRYGDLMKFSSYFLGDLHGRGETILTAPRIAEVIAGHWFEPYFHRLSDAMEGLASNYGKWIDLKEFDVIAEVARDVFVEGGLLLSTQKSGQLYVGVPYTPETLPDEDWIAQWSLKT